MYKDRAYDLALVIIFKRLFKNFKLKWFVKMLRDAASE